MSGELVAIIGGYAWSNWTAFEASADVLTPASAFSLTLADVTPDQVAAVEEGVALTLMMGTTVVLSGWVDAKRLEVSRSGGTELMLEGRDQMAPLVDCSAPVEWSWTNLSLADLATRVLTLLGVTATVSADADALTPIPVIRSDPGETCWELLTRYSRRQRLLCWGEPGVLRIGRPSYTGSPVGRLRYPDGPARGTGNILSSSHVWRTSGRRTPVTVLGQAAGTDGLWGTSVAHLKGTAADDGLAALGLYRPLVLSDGSVDSTRSAKDRARYEVSRRAGEAWVGTYVIRSHGPSEGQVWAVNTLVDVLDDVAGIRGPRWVASRTLQMSRRAGSTTTLTLRDLNAILPP